MHMLEQKRVGPRCLLDKTVTYHTESEVHGIAYERPALLAEPQYGSVYPARISLRHLKRHVLSFSILVTSDAIGN